MEGKPMNKYVVGKTEVPALELVQVLDVIRNKEKNIRECEKYIANAKSPAKLKARSQKRIDANKLAINNLKEKYGLIVVSKPETKEAPAKTEQVVDNTVSTDAIGTCPSCGANTVNGNCEICEYTDVQMQDHLKTQGLRISAADYLPAQGTGEIASAASFDDVKLKSKEKKMSTKKTKVMLEAELVSALAEIDSLKLTLSEALKPMETKPEVKPVVSNIVSFRRAGKEGFVLGYADVKIGHTKIRDFEVLASKLHIGTYYLRSKRSIGANGKPLVNKTTNKYLYDIDLDDSIEKELNAQLAEWIAKTPAKIVGASNMPAATPAATPPVTPADAMTKDAVNFLAIGSEVCHGLYGNDNHILGNEVRTYKANANHSIDLRYVIIGNYKFLMQNPDRAGSSYAARVKNGDRIIQIYDMTLKNDSGQMGVPIGSYMSVKIANGTYEPTVYNPYTKKVVTQPSVPAVTTEAAVAVPVNQQEF